MSKLIGKAINPLVGLAAEAYQHNKTKNSRGGSASSSPQDYYSQDYQPREQRAGPPDNLPPRYDDIENTKSSSRANRSHSHSSTGSTSSSETDNDEDDWARDETQLELSHSKDAPKSAAEPNKLLAEFFARHPDHLRNAPFPPLPCPVIIPQRRPSAKSRGFIHAYAPVLNDSGIDEALFIDFLTGFERAIQNQGKFNILNIAVGMSVLAETIAVGPSIIVHFSALAVHLSIEAGRRLYESYKTNGYLDLMNEHLFKPRGLYAMIMSYKPGSSDVSQVIDMKTNNVSAVAAHEAGRSKFRAAAGRATEDQLPECAPLVFPRLERASDEEKKGAFKRSMAFVADYYNKRAQATWQQKNPESKLNIPGTEPQFASPYGDPRHDAYSGGVISLLSGGRGGGSKNQRRTMREDRRIERRQLRSDRTGRAYRPTRQEMRKQRMGVAPDDDRSVRELRREQKQKRRDQGLTPISFVKRQLGENVLYLMIVNLPTQQEMAQAREMTKNSGLFS